MTKKQLKKQVRALEAELLDVYRKLNETENGFGDVLNDSEILIEDNKRLRDELNVLNDLAEEIRASGYEDGGFMIYDDELLYGLLDAVELFKDN